MALSMEEERILTEIALQLSEDDPALARRLATFESPPRRRGVRAVVTIIVAVLLIVSLVGAAFTGAVPL